MVTVEFRCPPPAGETGYRTEAELTVFADGSHKVVGDETRIPFEVPVPVRDDSGAVRPLTFAEDPAQWARHLRRVLRTGYLVPVVTIDDEL